MKREFVVTDGEGNISWSAKTESTEKFSTFKAAKKRAEELAASEPGTIINIYELTAQAVAPVGRTETKRAHPIEHYS